MSSPVPEFMTQLHQTCADHMGTAGRCSWSSSLLPRKGLSGLPCAYWPFPL